MSIGTFSDLATQLLFHNLPVVLHQIYILNHNGDRVRLKDVFMVDIICNSIKCF